MLNFTLQVLLDVSAQASNCGISNAQRLGQFVGHFWQVGRFNLLQGHQEVRLFASHFFAVVVGGEVQRECLAFARLHAAHCIFKFFEHLAFAEQELEVFGFAALEWLAVDLAFEVDGHAVAVSGSAVCRALSECAALLAQDVDGFVDGSVCHFGRHSFHFNAAHVGKFHFWVHLEDGVELHLAFWCAFFFSDARLTSNAQLGFVGGQLERFAHFVIHHFELGGVAVALGHDVHWHFAWTEAVNLDLACHALQTHVHFFGNHIYGQAQSDLAFQFFQSFNGHSHVFLLIWQGQAATRQLAINQVVRGAGLEPAHPCGRQDLNLVRLPISPPARVSK